MKLDWYLISKVESFGCVWRRNSPLLGEQVWGQGVGEKQKQPNGGQQYSYVSSIDGKVGILDIPINPFLSFPLQIRVYIPPLTTHHSPLTLISSSYD